MNQSYGSTDLPAVIIVHVEQLDCSATDRREANNEIALPGEVLGPLLRTRMEQRDELAVHARRDIAAFSEIAPMAGQAAIGFVATPTVLAGDDVLDVERDEWQLVLVQAAVFAPIARSLANETTKGGVHGHDG